MTKEVVEYVEPMETCGRARKASRSRDIFSALEDRADEVNGGLTNGLQSMKEQLRDYVSESLDSIENKLIDKDDTLEAMMTTLKEEIAELKCELTIYKAALGNGRLADTPKPKEFKGTRSARDV
ncbi:hypothetical protein J1N35_001117 [Gossypium stocksii]|uniref:Uncharacterized protein n=1 Tax=Gossypium stocksii TaxID=47602 RepID=A0A9D4ALT5_9ROSI|nr:hypothetical protein J1N35_001117 [Gossypium stocksii]